MRFNKNNRRERGECAKDAMKKEILNNKSQISNNKFQKMAKFRDGASNTIIYLIRLFFLGELRASVANVAVYKRLTATSEILRFAGASLHNDMVRPVILNPTGCGMKNLLRRKQMGLVGFFAALRMTFGRYGAVILNPAGGGVKNLLQREQMGLGRFFAALRMTFGRYGAVILNPRRMRG